MAAPAQRRALGVLFLVLAVFFTGIAVAALRADAGRLERAVIVVAAGALALWLAGLALRALRRG